MTKHVRQSDLARHLGVSRATVSLALSNHPRISPERRREVQQLAQDMGYRPDPALAALSAYRRSRQAVPVHSSLAWINRWLAPRELYGFREFECYWRGAAGAADKFGYHLEEFVWSDTLSPRRLASILRARGIRGIFIPPHRNQPEWGDFPWHEFSIVRFGQSVKQPEVHLVTTDQMQAALTAFRCMTERGYRRIGFTLPEITERNTGGAYTAGFLRAQQDVPQKNRVPILFTPTGTRAPREALDRWLKRWKPDAVLTVDPRIASTLAMLGLQPGKDIGLATTSVLDGNASAGIDQNSLEVGRMAVEMMIGLIHLDERGIPTLPRRLLVEGRWVEGRTLPPQTTENRRT